MAYIEFWKKLLDGKEHPATPFLFEHWIANHAILMLLVFASAELLHRIRKLR